MRDASPLQLGLDDERSALIDVLQAHTTQQGRILWEDRSESPLRPHWTALLPLLTERAYVGGLDAEAGIDHAANGLIDRVLAGKPVRDRTNEELRDYCERYNVGWVVCWTPAAVERFHMWDQAELTATLPPCGTDDSPGCLFTIRRKLSFALTGEAQWISADAQRIVLGNVVPSRVRSGQSMGQIVLSLHYHAGMRVSPSRVRVESVESPPKSLPSDAIPFVRLRVDEPVTRVTITWDKR
jgi:hypothetical protein